MPLGRCEAYFWMAGKGTEAEGAWHFLLHPSLPQRTNSEALFPYGLFIKEALFQ